MLPEVSPTSKTKDTRQQPPPSHVRPGNEWQALQALRVAEEERREQNEIARVKEMEKKRREQLDDQMQDFKVEKEKQRQEWMQEVLKGRADREILQRDVELQKRKEAAKRAENKQQHLEELNEKKQRLEHEKSLQLNEDIRLAQLAEQKYREQEIATEQDHQRAQSHHHPHPSSKAAPVPDKENFPHWSNQENNYGGGGGGGGGMMNSNQHRQGKQPTGTGGPTAAVAGKVLRYGLGGQVGTNVNATSSSPTRMGTGPGQMQGLGLPKSILRESRSAAAGMADLNYGNGGFAGTGTGVPRGHTAKATRTAAVDDRYHAGLMRKNVRAVALENALLREEKNQRMLAEKKQAYMDAQREEQKIAASLQHAQEEQKYSQIEQQKQYRAVLRDQIDAKQRAKAEWDGMSFVEKGINKPALIKIAASDINSKQPGR